MQIGKPSPDSSKEKCVHTVIIRGRKVQCLVGYKGGRDREDVGKESLLSIGSQASQGRGPLSLSHGKFLSRENLIDLRSVMVNLLSTGWGHGVPRSLLKRYSVFGVCTRVFGDEFNL